MEVPCSFTDTYYLKPHREMDFQIGAFPYILGAWFEAPLIRNKLCLIKFKLLPTDYLIIKIVIQRVEPGDGDENDIEEYENESNEAFAGFIAATFSFLFSD
jgi:hypothetical protein